jgi:4-hydroxybutyrate dehydrogenase
MPEVLKFNRPAIEARFDMVAAYLGINGGYQGFCDFVDEFNASLGIPRTLAGIGVKNPDVDALTKSALNDPSVGGNPMPMTYDNTRALL